MTNVYQMEELDFFRAYNEGKECKENTQIESYLQRYRQLYESIPELPLSNIWVAQKLSKVLPENSVLHLGIRNSLRSWGFFDIPESVLSYSNTGGFGIDGGVSSLIGASMVAKDKLFFGVFGDLLFFYDMNSIGNRGISSNLRILVINNGLGQEFKNYSCTTSFFLGEEADSFICAKGHYGNKSKTLIKNFAENLGFEYLTASNKDEFEKTYMHFVTPEMTDRPMLFEVFTNTEEENQALEEINTLSAKSKMMKKAQSVINSSKLAGVKDSLRKVLRGEH